MFAYCLEVWTVDFALGGFQNITIVIVMLGGGRSGLWHLEAEN